MIVSPPRHRDQHTSPAGNLGVIQTAVIRRPLCSTTGRRKPVRLPSAVDCSSRRWWVLAVALSGDWGPNWGRDYPTCTKGASAWSAGTNALQNAAFRRLVRRPEPARTTCGHSRMNCSATSTAYGPNGGDRIRNRLAVSPQTNEGSEPAWPAPLVVELRQPVGVRPACDGGTLSTRRRLGRRGPWRRWRARGRP